jgi:hypothetical protein
LLPNTRSKSFCFLNLKSFLSIVFLINKTSPDLNSQSLSAFTPARSKHSPSTRLSHSGQKTMNSRPFLLFRLVSPFHSI